jgi:hypothetical protein
MKPRQELTQQTYVGRFWRFVNFNTNQTIGGYCGIPGYIDVIIKDKDVTAVEGNRKYLQSAIKQLNLWPAPSNALQEESQPSLAVMAIGSLTTPKNVLSRSLMNMGRRVLQPT